MAFVAVLLLAAGTLLTYSGLQGTSPTDVLRAVLKGEKMPAPKFVIEKQVAAATGGPDIVPQSGGGPALAGGFARPLSAFHVVSPYGMRMGRMHEGIDLAASMGTPIYAAAAGTVDRAGYDPGGAGNRVNIRHNSTYLTKYFHMSRVAATVGQHVSQGQVIGYVGSTGRSSGPHLHFEIWKNGQTVNPAGYVR